MSKLMLMTTIMSVLVAILFIIVTIYAASK